MGHAMNPVIHGVTMELYTIMYSVLIYLHYRGPARTSVNWSVHGNTSCPPSWRAMNQLIYQSPTQIALLHASAVERELWKLNAHFV